MNASRMEPARWSGLRWWSAAGGVFAVQVLLVLKSSVDSTPVSRHANDRPVYKLLADTTVEGQMNEFLAASDPTVFALVNRHGFSGPAWLNVPPLEHRLSDATNQPYWLRPAVAQLGKDFDAFVKTNRPVRLTLAEQVAPQVAILVMPNDLMATQSVLRIEGELARRPLVKRFDLPPIPHTDILPNTVVRLWVNRTGYVLLTTLLARSGSPKADQLALDLSKTARFESHPLPERGASPGPYPLASGDMIFEWHTIAETNNAANPRPP